MIAIGLHYLEATQQFPRWGLDRYAAGIRPPFIRICQTSRHNAWAPTVRCIITKHNIIFVRCSQWLQISLSNCKLYSPSVTTPLQKTANWEGLAYSGEPRKKKKEEEEKCETPASQARLLLHNMLGLLWDLPQWKAHTKTCRILTWLVLLESGKRELSRPSEIRSQTLCGFKLTEGTEMWR